MAQEHTWVTGMSLDDLERLVEQSDKLPWGAQIALPKAQWLEIIRLAKIGLKTRT